MGYKRYICCVARYRSDIAAFRGACISSLAICGIIVYSDLILPFSGELVFVSGILSEVAKTCKQSESISR
jgi:hypothetical protein